MKRPSFQFYPGDWRRDTALQSCSIGARGLWIEMLCLMHDGTPYGHLRVSSKDILPPILARMAGVSFPDVEGYLEELGAAGVLGRTDGGTLFSKRMVRDEEIRQARAAGGPKSLDNPHVPRPKDTLEGYPSTHPSPPSSWGSFDPSPAVAVASAKEKPSRATARETWLTPFLDGWQRHRGKPSAGRLATSLRPLVEQRGPRQTLAAWLGYLESRDGKPFCTVEDFTANYEIHRSQWAVEIDEVGDATPIPDEPLAA